MAARRRNANQASKGRTRSLQKHSRIHDSPFKVETKVDTFVPVRLTEQKEAKRYASVSLPVLMCFMLLASVFLLIFETETSSGKATHKPKTNSRKILD